MNINPDKVPATLEEAVELLLAGLDPKDRAYLEDNGTVGTHFGLGISLRNGWSLWEDTPLRRNILLRFGIIHGDDLSGLLLHCLHQEVLGKPWEADRHVERYKQHWREQGLDPATMEPLKKKKGKK